jgi:hypothetical protein
MFAGSAKPLVLLAERVSFGPIRRGHRSRTG